jgi:hypothetical protein
MSYLLTDKELKNFDYIQEKNRLKEDDLNKLFLSYYDPKKTYINPGKCTGFGDAFGWANFITRMYVASGTPIKISRIPDKTKESLKLLIPSVPYTVSSDSPSLIRGGDMKKRFREIYSWRFFPTFQTWEPNNNKFVAYQFGHGGQTDRQVQNKEDEKLILETLKNKGYTPIELGGFLTNSGCIENAIKCEFFVGTCSGMSHLCHAIGLPCHILTNLRSLERVAAGHVKNVRRDDTPTTFWQHPHHFIAYIKSI